MASVLAAAGVAWVGARAGPEGRPRRLAMIDAVLASVGLALTLSGIVIPRPGALGPSEPSWGLALGVALAAAWAIAAWWAFREAEASDLRRP